MSQHAPEVMLPIAAIRVGRRLRDVDMDHVQFLSVSMDERGLDTALQVREPNASGKHELIAGAHRLAAARLLGWQDVPVKIYSVDNLTARLMEVDENLFRRELSPLDRAIFLAQRKEVYEALHPETRRGGDRSQTENLVSLIPSFADATAIKLGVDARTVFRAVARARAIGPDTRKIIGTSWIAQSGSALDALAKLAPDDQVAVAKRMLSEDAPIKSVPAALRLVRGEADDATPDDDSAAQLAALVKAWRRAGQRARDGFVEFLAREGAVEPDQSQDEAA